MGSQARKGFDQGERSPSGACSAGGPSFKLQEPILLLGKDRFADIDIRIRVKGGGHTSQVYAIDRRCPSPWLPTIRSTSMSSPSRRSRTFLCSLTGLCWLPTQGGTSPRSLEVRVRAPDTRSPIVKRWQNLSQCCYIACLWLVKRWLTKV